MQNDSLNQELKAELSKMRQELEIYRNCYHLFKDSAILKTEAHQKLVTSFLAGVLFLPSASKLYQATLNGFSAA